jgi:hypothetical protein
MWVRLDRGLETGRVQDTPENMQLLVQASSIKAATASASSVTSQPRPPIR